MGTRTMAKTFNDEAKAKEKAFMLGLFDEQEEDDDDDDEILPFWEKVAEDLDGKRYTYFIIGATMVSVVLSVYGLTLDEDEDWQTAFEYFFLYLFTQDCALRIAITGYWDFFKDWLCLIDFLIVSIDWIGIGIGAVSPETTIVVKMLRLARLVRIFRIVRAARLAKQKLIDKQMAVKVIKARSIKSRRYKADRETKLLMHGKLIQVRMLRQLSLLSLELRMNHFAYKGW